MPSETRGKSPYRPPTSTYRVQFNREFTFRDGRAIAPYLRELGVSDLYASPYLQARPGSMHGYDISDHSNLNPELGGPEDHTAMVAALRENSLGHMLDIVPNHMGIGEPSNLWWMDVLENGPTSAFAPFFDIDWDPLKSSLAGKVLLPILGDQFGVVLESGDLKLVFEDGCFRIHYFEQQLPVAPRSSSLVLRRALQKTAELTSQDDDAFLELESIVMALEHLPLADRSDPESTAMRRRESAVSRRRLLALRDSSETFRRALDAALAEYNGIPGDPASFDALEGLLNEQSYRLAYWRVAAEEINYRRFFDINDLAGIRVERPEVFQSTHRLILRLIREGKVTSLRVDHPDGLFDPYGYLRDLQAQASRNAGVEKVYIVVEKILTGEEKLPDTWPVAGTVGYDFLNRLNGLFVESGNADALARIYREFIGRRTDLAHLVYEKKKLILRVALGSELNVLAYHLSRIAQAHRRSRDFTLGALTDALREIIACFPVYRTYIDARVGRVGRTDVEHVDQAIHTAMRRNRATSPTIFRFIRSTLLLECPENLDDAAREEHALFVMKFQQLTGPVMAKGVEDTSFYIYNRLTSLNEVGGEPEHFGVLPEAFHDWMLERAREWPLAMNGTTTHDTKRSEDVRARIHVLSEMPDEWEARVRAWAEMNAVHKSVDGEPVPDANDEYLLYQTLIGTWPLDPAELNETYRARIQRYMEKSTREAKVNTSWINPNETYDAALNGFIGKLLDFDTPAGSPFLKDIDAFQRSIAADGMVNSLAQLVIKLAAPGVADIYQGQELWQLTLVDPDNRQPIDYELRRRLLGELKERTGREPARVVAADLLENWRDGRIKLYVTHTMLSLRQRERELFEQGSYEPVLPDGGMANHVVAFGRQFGEMGVLAIVPRLPYTFRKETRADVWQSEAWGETVLDVPDAMRGWTMRELFTGYEITLSGETLRVGEVIDGFPVAILERIE